MDKKKEARRLHLIHCSGCSDCARWREREREDLEWEAWNRRTEDLEWDEQMYVESQG